MLLKKRQIKLEISLFRREYGKSYEKNNSYPNADSAHFERPRCIRGRDLRQ